VDAALMRSMFHHMLHKKVGLATVGLLPPQGAIVSLAFVACGLQMWSAKINQYLLTQSVRVCLTCFREFYNFVCKHFVVEVIPAR